MSVVAPRDTGGVLISSLKFLALVRQPPSVIVLRSAVFGGPASGISAAYDLATDIGSIFEGQVDGLQMSTSYSVRVLCYTGLALSPLPGVVTVLHASITASCSVDLRGLLPVGSMVHVAGSFFSVDDRESPFTNAIVPLSAYYDGPDLINATMDLVTNGSTVAGPVTAMTVLPTIARGALAPVASHITGGAVSLTLRRPDDSGGIILSFMAVYMAEGVVLDRTSASYALITKIVFSGLAGEFTESKLAANTTYSFYSIPENALTTCVELAPSPSPVMTVVTLLPTIPSEPLDLHDNVSCAACPDGRSGGAIAIVWSEPFDLGGVYEIMYYVQMSVTCGGPASFLTIANTTLKSHQQNGLVSASSYCFRVQASTTAAGLGGISAVAAISTPNSTIPGKPMAPRQMHATGGVITIGWNPPADNGGSAVTGYNVLIKPYALPDSAYVTFNTTALQLDIGNLTEVTLYGVRISAFNAVGASEPSAVQVMTTTARTAPSAPISLQETGVTGGSISLSWSPPFDNGGVPIARYNVIVAGHVRDVVTAAASPQHTVYGLDFLTTYTIAVEAVNTAPLVGLSSVVLSLTTLSVPTAPTRVVSLVEASPATGGALSFAWLPPLDTGGVPLQRYRIYQATAAAFAAADSSALARVRDTTDNNLVSAGLNPNTAFVICVTAINNPQLPFTPLEGPCNYLRLATTNVTAPSQPVSVAVAVVSVGSVLVNWALPIDVGGSASGNVSFTVFYRDLASSSSVFTNVSVPQSTFSLAVSGLNGINYAVKVVRACIVCALSCVMSLTTVRWCDYCMCAVALTGVPSVLCRRLKLLSPALAPRQLRCSLRSIWRLAHQRCLFLWQSRRRGCWSRGTRRTRLLGWTI